MTDATSTTVFYRALGRSGIQISAMGLGCWAMGGPFWRGDKAVGWGDVDDSETTRGIHRGLELGVNFFDTADVYGTGHSEEVLGEALKGRRDKAVIATKFGNTFDPVTKQGLGADASPAYIRQACDASLQRLQTDYIDLYQLHLGGYDLDKAAEVRETLEELVKAGKIRAYGWSTDDPARARLFAEGEHCAAVQVNWNVLEDAAEMKAVCEQFNLAAINRGPLAMGLLTGKYSANSTLPGNDVRGENSPAWMQLFKDGKPNPVYLKQLEAVREILTSGGRSLAQGALAWLWARSPLTIPIPGFKTVAQVNENVGAMKFGPLTADQMQQIDSVLVR
ncbi:MAG: aldo/keto reductase [Anaerolineae bacterium]|nr:aldo/keto reductase [Anaerolineae bacterium]